MSLQSHTTHPNLTSQTQLFITTKITTILPINILITNRFNHQTMLTNYNNNNNLNRQLSV